MKKESGIFVTVFTAFVFILLNSDVFAGVKDEVSDLEKKETVFASKDKIDFTRNEFFWEIKAGVILTTGNTDSFAVTGGQDLKWRIPSVELPMSLF